MASGCTKGHLDLILGKNSPPKSLSSIGKGFPEKLWSHHPWKYLKTCIHGALEQDLSNVPGSVRFAVGHNDLTCLFQSELLNELQVQITGSVTMYTAIDNG